MFVMMPTQIDSLFVDVQHVCCEIKRFCQRKYIGCPLTPMPSLPFSAVSIRRRRNRFPSKIHIKMYCQI